MSIRRLLEFIKYLFFMLVVASCLMVINNDLYADITLGDAKKIEFSVSVLDQVTINNVVFFQEHIANNWLLQFRKKNGLIITKRVESKNIGLKKISLDEYLLALNNSLLILEKEIVDLKLDQIQIDVGLIEEAWSEVVATTKSVAAKQPGVVSHKNKIIQHAVIQAIDNSKLVFLSCEVLAKHSYNCSQNMMSINPIAFKTDCIGKEWKKIVSLSDAGLNEGMWFSINIE